MHSTPGSIRLGTNCAILVLTMLGWLLFATPVAAEQNNPTPAGNSSQQGKVGDTELHWAAFRGHEKLVQQLLDGGASINQSVDSGSTALHMAAYNGHERVIAVLIENGADVNARTDEGITPLDWSRRNGHTGAEALLLAHGAVVGKPLPAKKKQAAQDQAVAAADQNPGRFLLATSGEYREKAPAKVEEEIVEQPIDPEELNKLESVSRANQIVAEYRAARASELAVTSEDKTVEEAAPEEQSNAAPVEDSSQRGYRVQLVAISDLDRAVAARDLYKARYADILDKRDLIVETSSGPDAEIHRVRSVPLSAREAALLCDQLKLGGQDCFVTKQ